MITPPLTFPRTDLRPKRPPHCLARASPLPCLRVAGRRGWGRESSRRARPRAARASFGRGVRVRAGVGEGAGAARPRARARELRREHAEEVSDARLTRQPSSTSRPTLPLLLPSPSAAGPEPLPGAAGTSISPPPLPHPGASPLLSPSQAHPSYESEGGGGEGEERRSGNAGRGPDSEDLGSAGSPQRRHNRAGVLGLRSGFFLGEDDWGGGRWAGLA